MNRPMVSVIVVTYNHESYIGQCLEGILSQKTNFPIEIILGEDQSTDGTRKVCQKYAEEYPDIIRLFLRDRKDVIYINGNPTGRFNFIENLKESKGKYIALCDGDDYWTDPLKLQKQVDFLESNTDYAICFHEAKIQWEQRKNYTEFLYNSDFPWNAMSPEKDVYGISDVIKGSFMATNTVVFRKELMPELPKWYEQIQSGDMALYALITGNNKIKFLNEVMATYRRHEGGVSRTHRTNAILINRLMLLKYIDSYYKGAYREIVIGTAASYINQLQHLSAKELLTLWKLKLSSKILKLGPMIKLTQKKIKSL
ncbi:glycosyltransferase [Gilvibacter sediminis]|uniref:glycosyltransferase n=1 Tax=Gilvibacter sediminis TaxID=379071 RepID=UPI00234FE0AE|nr:glycosyltransferase [Gilvibacter sediminis]MDC7999268.1 glycosyltransferase [Gilvibacter sediminis]